MPSPVRVGLVVGGVEGPLEPAAAGTTSPVASVPFASRDALP
jgi:hypothetical protein